MPEAGSPGPPRTRARGRRDLRGRVAALARELRNHPFGYGVMGAFLVAGPLVATALFPEAPRGVCVVGGLALGAYAAMCAVPNKFL